MTPTIIAECWTCAFDEFQAYGPAEPIRGRCYTPEDVSEHRAAGHDVRPVNEARKGELKP